MSEDRPLTEFTAGEAEPEDSESNAEATTDQSAQAATTETNARSEGDDASNRDAVEPATITYHWQPGARRALAVRRRPSDSGEMVTRSSVPTAKGGNPV
ncbi:hypothetical protein [Halonotius sp. GCM10025705]|uniref:hypothetical protein n=1 Tax=Halonotius sp. GCM10025705 TaxID=3252678 RepID=UPI00360FD8CC